MLHVNFDYESCVKASERVAWRLDDLMPQGTRLDFTRKFLPEALVPTEPLATLDGQLFLSADERLKLNQIAGNAYLNLFHFVEEYILVTMMKHAQAEVFGNSMNLRALTRFVDEELKHQALFARYREAFERDFGHPCGVLETAVQVAGIILSHSPAAVLLVTLHIELMTLQHYTECVKDNAEVDPLFQALLKHHWLEESQHARIDVLELQKLSRVLPQAAIDTAFDEYLSIVESFDGLLKEQAALDVASLSVATGRAFDTRQSEAILASQLASYRRTFLWYGMTNGTFVEYQRQLSPEKAQLVKERSAKFSGGGVDGVSLGPERPRPAEAWPTGN